MKNTVVILPKSVVTPQVVKEHNPFDLQKYNNYKGYSMDLYSRLDELHSKNKDITISNHALTSMLSCSNRFTRSVKEFNPKTKEVELIGKEYGYSKKDRINKVRSQFTCKNRFCAVCQYKKSRKNFYEVYDALTYLDYFTGSSHSYYHLTLTVKNPNMGDLRSTLKDMQKAWTKMFVNDKYENNPYFKKIRKAVKGWFRGIEYLGDNTKEGEAHPHYHVLLVMPNNYRNNKNYISADEWRQAWKYALKADYTPMIRIDKIRAKKATKKGAPAVSALVSAVSEVVKYSTKPSDVLKLSDDDLLELLSQTHRLQTFTKSKHFRNINKALLTDQDYQDRIKAVNDSFDHLYTEHYGYSFNTYFLYDRTIKER
jgi:plasmid rolling circle replication initiator protein Rep